MKLTLPLLAFLAPSALADFWIGNCASSSNSPSPQDIALPGSDLDCNYKAYPGNSDICNSTQLIDTKNNGGVCPGNDDNRSLSFCGIELAGSGCPASFQISELSEAKREDRGGSADASFVQIYGTIVVMQHSRTEKFQTMDSFMEI